MTETVFSSSMVWKWMMLEDMEDLEAGAYMMLQTTGSVNHIQLFTWENLMKSNISIIPNSKLRLHSGIQMWGWIKVSKWDCLVICFCIDIIKKIVLSDTKYCTAPKKLVTAKLKKKKIMNGWCIQVQHEQRILKAWSLLTNVIPSLLPSSHPWGLLDFFSALSFLSSRRSPAATILHVNSGTPSWRSSHVLLLPGQWWPGEIKVVYMWRRLSGCFTANIYKRTLKKLITNKTFHRTFHRGLS